MSRAISNHGRLVDTMLPWCRDTVVSPIQSYQDFMKDAVLAVFPVIFYYVVDRNSRDLIFASLYAVIFIGVDDVGYGSFFL